MSACTTAASSSCSSTVWFFSAGDRARASYEMGRSASEPHRPRRQRHYTRAHSEEHQGHSQAGEQRKHRRSHAWGTHAFDPLKGARMHQSQSAVQRKHIQQIVQRAVSWAYEAQEGASAGEDETYTYSRRLRPLLLRNRNLVSRIDLESFSRQHIAKTAQRTTVFTK